MIKRIDIQNFQSHANTSLEFHNGVNVIVGSSDSGKSAIIRALRWVVYGKPRGDAICSWWADTNGGLTRVAVCVENKVVAREKNKSGNEYQLYDALEDTEVIFKATGTDTPVEIESVLNLHEINLQQQSDRPFLISNTAGEVAAHFNHIANMEKIDISLRNIQSTIRTTTSSIGHEKQALNNLRSEYQSYTWLTEAEVAIEELEEIINIQTSVQNEIHEISQRITDVNELEKEIKAFSSILTADSLLGDIKCLLEEKKSVQLRKTTIQSILTDINELQNEINTIQSRTNANILLNELLQLVTAQRERKQLYSELQYSSQEFIKCDLHIEGLEKNIKHTEKTLKEVMPSTCPLCKSNIKHHAAN